MNCQIESMTITHLRYIERILSTEFDNFWNFSVLEAELQNPNSHYIVALDNNSVLGFAGIWKAVDQYHITDIVVRKDLRQKGIGSQLLEKLIEIVKFEKITSITLEVNIQNTAAISLYKKYNFRVVGTRKKYYFQKYDALIMTLFLN